MASNISEALLIASLRSLVSASMVSATLSLIDSEIDLGISIKFFFKVAVSKIMEPNRT
jgi:hypothetical protein